MYFLQTDSLQLGKLKKKPAPVRVSTAAALIHAPPLASRKRKLTPQPQQQQPPQKQQAIENEGEEEEVERKILASNLFVMHASLFLSSRQ
jgi:hypothetical protein